ncbi:MAG: TATA-box-binding protein [Thermoplasmata archaeon]|nr:TATA-box-binding protein [Thermoplasmata archaeon]
MPETHVANFVVTTHLSEWFDLDYIAYNLPGGEYSPNVFPGLTYVLDNPKSAVLIMRNGRVAVTGTKSMEDAQSALEYVVELLTSLGVSAYYNTDIKVLNIVGFVNLEEEIDLHTFYNSLSTPKAEFDPEKFPGIVYRMGDGIDMLIFQSGKVVFTGAKSMDSFKASAEMGAELVESKLSEASAEA